MCIRDWIGNKVTGGYRRSWRGSNPNVNFLKRSINPREWKCAWCCFPWEFTLNHENIMDLSQYGSHSDPIAYCRASSKPFSYSFYTSRGAPSWWHSKLKMLIQYVCGWCLEVVWTKRFPLFLPEQFYLGFSDKSDWVRKDLKSNKSGYIIHDRGELYEVRTLMNRWFHQRKDIYAISHLPSTKMQHSGEGFMKQTMPAPQLELALHQFLSHSWNFLLMLVACIEEVPSSL